jgi:transposase InsO family protein
MSPRGRWIASIGRSWPPGRIQQWIADFTYVTTWMGFVHVAFVIGVFARCFVGWRVRLSGNGGMLACGNASFTDPAQRLSGTDI